MADSILLTPEMLDGVLLDEEIATGVPPPMLPIGTGALAIANHHFSMVPHDFVDLYMAHITGADTKVWLYLLRRTRCSGHPQPAAIHQLVDGLVVNGQRLDNGVGLERMAVLRALRRLQDLGLVETKQPHDISRHQAALYGIREAGPALVTDLRRARK